MSKDILIKAIEIIIYGVYGVIITATTREGYTTAPRLLRPRGTLVGVGIPTDPNIVAGASPVLLCSVRICEDFPVTCVCMAAQASLRDWQNFHIPRDCFVSLQIIPFTRMDRSEEQRAANEESAGLRAIAKAQPVTKTQLLPSGKGRSKGVTRKPWPKRSLAKTVCRRQRKGMLLFPLNRSVSTPLCRA